MKFKKKLIDELGEEVKIKQKKKLPKRKYRHFSTWLEDIDLSSFDIEISQSGQA